MAVAKQAATIATQIALAVLDLAVEVCTKPWIVELSKNSRKIEEAISLRSISIAAVAQNMLPPYSETHGQLSCLSCEGGTHAMRPWRPLVAQDGVGCFLLVGGFLLLGPKMVTLSMYVEKCLCLASYLENKFSLWKCLGTLI